LGRVGLHRVFYVVFGAEVDNARTLLAISCGEVVAVITCRAFLTEWTTKSWIAEVDVVDG
jgi:hypothetical protein